MPDPEFPYLKIGRKGRWQKRNISNVSDGDQRHWPPRPAYRPSSDENYLIKLGQEWVDRDGVGMIGVQYYINSLPHGYAVWEADSGDGTQAYKRLFGHPSGKYYDSIPTFLPHFLWLQDGMQNDCTCRLCEGRGTVATGIMKTRRPRNALDYSSIIPSRMTRDITTRDITTRDSDVSTRESSTSGLATGRVRRDVKQSGAPYARDEEGTEDVYKPFVKRLEGARNSIRGTDDDIREPNSIDWRAEHEHGEYGTDTLLTHITQIEQQHSFVPRVGELVLWCPHFLDSHYLMFDCATSEYKYHSFSDKRFHGHPTWRAGVVTEVPSAITQNGPVDFPDILHDPDKRTSLNTAGFRVETMPDPNDPLNKSGSKQYKFVPLRNIRPLSQWQSILRGIPEKKLHASIKNALTCMTSVSLVEKFKAVGHWPSASIFCKGLFLGSELIIVGDTVRLASEKSTKCTDVLVIESIRLNLEDMEQDHILPKHPLLCSKSSITLVGTAYTLDRNRSYEMSAPDRMIDDDLEQVVIPTPVSREVVKVIFHPVGSAEYGPWYRLHAQTQKYQVSHEQVLGRLYEAEAVRLWTGLRQENARSGESTKAPSLDFDVSGIMSARRYAACADERLPASRKRVALVLG
jgi:Transcription-silencing protein Clr2/Transcription-silencing protein, cryptic loci regulator Clr2